MQLPINAHIAVEGQKGNGRHTMLLGIWLPLLFAALLLSAPFSAEAAPKQAIAYIGMDGGGPRGGQFTTPGDIAVNSTGAGVADKGDIYVVDRGSNRVQRIAQDDNGTPENPYDDSYPFISAWGTGVESGENKYEICSNAASCKDGLHSGGNGSISGNGSIDRPMGIAVDQDTGDVYLADAINYRVNVYSGDGQFLRSFGYDVVESGPDEAGVGYEICIAANGDVCKSGILGSGPGQIGAPSGDIRFPGATGIAISPSDGNPATGSVYLGDEANRRVNTYGLDGSSPSNFGSPADFGEFGPEQIEVDSRGILYSVVGSEFQRVVFRYDTQNANGGGVGPLAPIKAPPLAIGALNRQIAGLRVDPDSDGPGPDSDVLYVLRNLGPDPETVVQQFGPVNAPGLTAPPVADDERHGGVAGFRFVEGLGFDGSSGRLFISTADELGDEPGKPGVYVLDKAGGVATASLESLSDTTATSVTLHGQVNPNGPPDASYHAEYSLDGTNWVADKSSNVVLGSQESPQSVSSVLSPPGGGLEPNTLYHVRLVATRPFNPPAVSSELTLTTAVAPPIAETAGSPVRTTTTAQLLGRVVPRNSPTTYHFEYGDQGACSANPCSQTPPIDAGSGGIYRSASAVVNDLQPNTTYHYRIVADNGNPGSPVFGEDMTVTTRATDQPLSHGHFPGPPGSDRAWEQVNLPDTGGNPVAVGNAYSDDGSRVIYQTSGGNPSSTVGSFVSQFLAERVETGSHEGLWKTQPIMPPREELIGGLFEPPSGPTDLSSFVFLNAEFFKEPRAFWQLSADAPPKHLFTSNPPQRYGWLSGSDRSNRAIATLLGPNLDPNYPEAGSQFNFYDITDGTPKLVSLLPGNVVSPCESNPQREEGISRDSRNWVSADGSLLFFRSCDQIYMRELDAEVTKPVSGSGAFGSECPAVLIKSNADAAFFWTQSRLASDDTSPSSCDMGNRDGDVYRYDIASGDLGCVTCVLNGLDADVYGSSEPLQGVAGDIAVSADGSTVYFRSANRLVQGAPQGGGGDNIYRVEVASGDLRWIAAAPNLHVGEESSQSEAITPSGSTILFRSADPSLNPLGGSFDNGGTAQYYLYDDRTNALVCASCPQDGTAPDSAVPGNSLVNGTGTGANLTPLADDGTFAFVTTAPLATVDQNTSSQAPRAGTDIYEWRDGQTLLVSDGLTDWPRGNAPNEPALGAISASGRDIFFTAAAQLTPDAPDGYTRMYDARVGGGFDFPAAPKPCPLEVCQGTPKGAPEEAAPGTASFAGSGTAAATTKAKKQKARKKQKTHKKRQHKRNAHKRAANNGRAHR